MRPVAYWLSDQSDQRVAGLERACLWARVARRTRSIELTCGDARKPNTRPLRTPDRPIAIPDRFGCALEGLAMRHDNSGKNEK